MSLDSPAIKTMKFEITRNGEISFLTYSRDRKGRITLWHTEVPPSLRGRGLGGELVQQAFAYAREHELKVELVCPFTTDYVSKHSELSVLVVSRSPVNKKKP